MPSATETPPPQGSTLAAWGIIMRGGTLPRLPHHAPLHRPHQLRRSRAPSLIAGRCRSLSPSCELAASSPPNEPPLGAMQRGRTCPVSTLNQKLFCSSVPLIQWIPIRSSSKRNLLLTNVCLQKKVRFHPMSVIQYMYSKFLVQ